MIKKIITVIILGLCFVSCGNDIVISYNVYMTCGENKIYHRLENPRMSELDVLRVITTTARNCEELKVIKQIGDTTLITLLERKHDINI